MDTFTATVSVVSDTVVLRLRGDLDRRAADRLPAVYEDATTKADGPVVLDLTDVGFINSTGIALIVGLLARARAEAREVRVCGLTDHYEHIFRITRLADFTTLYPDVASATGRAPTATG